MCDSRSILYKEFNIMLFVVVENYVWLSIIILSYIFLSQRYLKSSDLNMIHDKYALLVIRRWLLCRPKTKT